MSVHRQFWRVVLSSARSFRRQARLTLALGLVALFALSDAGQAQTEQDIRCMQLQQELEAARGGGGANAAEVGMLNQQIAEQQQILRATKSQMDSGCYERLLIFGRALKRTSRCLNMNAQVEDARRQLQRLEQQRNSLTRGGGNRRRQAELQQALERAGCSGAPSGGGLFDFFGGPQPEYQTPIYRSINPNGRYRSVCVRLCDGYYYPVSYSTYGRRVAQDATKCQKSCAAPAELYVYRNPGQEIEQAISLSGSAYMDLPVALRYRKEYVKGCSCKKSEYNPAEIEAANTKAQAPKAAPGNQANAAAAAAPAKPALPPGQMPQLNLDIDGSATPAQPAQQAAPAEPPAPAPVAEQQAPAAPAPNDGQSSVIKRTP